MSAKTYLLTIEYNDETEEIEYIQEEILGENSTHIVSELTMDNTAIIKFNKDSLEFIKKIYSGEIGES